HRGLGRASRSARFFAVETFRCGGEVMELPLPLIRLTGTREEIGGRLGERTRDAVAESIAWYARQFRDVAGITDADRTRSGQAFREQTRAWHPPIAAALDALDDAAGVD